ncbi:hypothetical protein GCM10022251_57830 [Phytohabitans flavus]
MDQNPLARASLQVGDRLGKILHIVPVEILTVTGAVKLVRADGPLAQGVNRTKAITLPPSGRTP